MGLDTVELVLAYEDAFDIAIPDFDAEKMITPRLVGDFVERALAERGRGLPREQIDMKIKEITIEQLGVKESEYWLDGEYVADFGVD